MRRQGDEAAPEADAAVASLKVVLRRSPAGGGSVDTVYDVKLWDKLRTLELAATHLGLLKKQVEQSGGIGFGRAAASRQAAGQGSIGRGHRIDVPIQSISLSRGSPA